MRHIALIAAAVVGFACSASAADIPAKAPAYRTVVQERWAGWYVGAHAGYGVMWTRMRDLDDNFDNENSASRRDGFLGGLQAGYNWQMGSTVVGWETDFSYTNIKGSELYNTNTATPERSDASLKWFGTTRARVGLATDRTLVYVTTGLAYAKIKQLHTELDVNPDFFASNKVHLGLAVGAGVDVAITENISARLEGMFVTLRNTGPIQNGQPGDTDRAGFGNDFGLVRAAINYKFGR